MLAQRLVGNQTLLPIREYSPTRFRGPLQEARNNEFSRTVLSTGSPEVRRKIAQSENEGAILAVGSSKSGSKQALIIGRNYQRVRPRELRRLDGLAEGRGFERMIRSRDFGPSGDYLLRNDWLSCWIGALLCLLGRGRGAL
jgi:hypothetical protein